MRCRRFGLSGVVGAAGCALVLFGLLAAACDRMPLYAPSGSGLTLLASANSLAVNGSAEITAFVLEGAQSASTPTAPGSVVPGTGVPVHDGTLVIFSTTLGRVDPSQAETKGGRATVRLVGDGRSGTATVTAISGPATNKLDLDIGAAAATHIAVTANPQELPSTGGTTTVSARVEDQQGNGLLGLPVSFSTTKGTLSTTTVYTNDQGFAVTSLTTTAEATVTASTGGAATALNGTVTITIRP